MKRGVNQRTAVAIALMGVLLFPVLMCMGPAQPVVHSCCLHMNMPAGDSARTCCTTNPQTPPAVVTSARSEMAGAFVTQVFVSGIEGAVPRESAVVSLVPAQSPPPGTFVLRI